MLNYALYINYDVFNKLKWVFLCFSVCVALYNVYKSMTDVRKSKLLPKLDINLNLAYLQTILNIKPPQLKRICLLFIIWVFRKLLHIIYDTHNLDINTLYMFLIFIAVWGSSTYLKSICVQLGKTGRIDFSLTSPYMRKDLTLKNFIRIVCGIILVQIFFLGYIL